MLVSVLQVTQSTGWVVCVFSLIDNHYQRRILTELEWELAMAIESSYLPLGALQLKRPS